MSEYKNLLLIKKAIELKKQVTLIPRRSHAIKGIPVNFEENILRVWVNTGKDIESILLSEISHFSCSVELWDLIEHDNIENLPRKQNSYIKVKKIVKEDKEKLEEKIPLNTQYENYVQTLKDGEKKLSYYDWLAIHPEV